MYVFTSITLKLKLCVHIAVCSVSVAAFVNTKKGFILHLTLQYFFGNITPTIDTLV